jgi:leucyl aminopeptidase (aminopeptidase T)
MFRRTVPIDYERLKRECQAVGGLLGAACAARIESPAGCDLRIGLRGREAFLDDGDFSKPGSGGNLPAGEAFISPELGTAEGTLVFDGSVSAHDGEILIEEPIRCELRGGFITRISGGPEAAELERTIALGEESAMRQEREGTLRRGLGEVYVRNSRGLGELGIGLNPHARIVGVMLEDEKAYRTCHIAIGKNYDEDANALIHLDGLITEPTITLTMENGSERVLMKRGDLLI